MVATFSWVEYNANATDTSVPTNLNFGSTNAADLAPSTYPITAGTYSYEKWVRGYWGGTFTRIENVQFWKSAGAYVTGESIKCNATTTSYTATTTYVAPTTDASTVSDMQAIPTADPGTANMGITAALAGSLTAAGYSDFIVLQTSVTTGASAGAVNQKTFTLQYDEV